MAEPLKATFFTLQRRDRAVLLPVTLVMAVLVALIIGLYVAFNWAFFAQIIEMVRSGEGQLQDDEQAATFGFGILALAFSGFLFLFPLYLVLAAYEAACLRWMIRGETPGLFGFTFDNDTWRVYGVYWCWLIAQFAVSMVMGILTMPIVFMMMGEMVAVASDPSSPDWWNLQIRMQALSLLQYIPLAFLGIRLGPAAATSVARKRFSFFDAWIVTRDRFWALFGSFALLWLIVGILSLTIIGGFWSYLAGDALWAIIREPYQDHSETVRTIFDRVWTTQGFAFVAGTYALNFIVYIGYFLMSYGINARAALAALDEGKISVYSGDD